MKRFHTNGNCLRPPLQPLFSVIKKISAKYIDEGEEVVLIDIVYFELVYCFKHQRWQPNTANANMADHSVVARDES